MTKHYCKDCNKLLSRHDAKRCKSCARKYQYATRPETHPMLGKHHTKSSLKKIGEAALKDGRCIKKNYCLSCGIKINWKARRCNTCAAKERSKLGTCCTRGNLKDGRSLKKYYCKCGNKIRWQTVFFGLGQCVSCACKTKMSSEVKHKLSLIFGGTGIPYENADYSRIFRNIRELIRKRDNYICQNCGCHEFENCRKLDVHHIDYNKDNNKKNNLISLCHSCHARTIVNRDEWIKYLHGEI